MFIIKKNQTTQDERAYQNRVNDFFLSSLLSQASEDDAKEIFELLDIKSSSEDSDKENTE
jgi:hypothetical protein